MTFFRGENMTVKYDDDAKIFKALSDEHRIAVMDMLISGEKCACELLEALNIGQSTLSHHMRILCDAGLVIPRKEGKWTYYSLSKAGISKLAEIVGRYSSASSAPIKRRCCCDK